MFNSCFRDWLVLGFQRVSFGLVRGLALKVDLMLRGS
jgi:hypothetical protein